MRLLIPRKKNSHKGDNGKVLVVGGSKDYVGALALTGLAALRTGADIVVIAAPEKVAWAINCLSPDLITIKVNGEFFSKRHAKKIIEVSKKFDVITIGNGIGTKQSTMEFVKNVTKHVGKPIVVDADGIKAIRIQDMRDAVITPHKKELEILLKNSGINKNNMQNNLGSNVLLIKGAVDTVISKDRIYRNKTGNAGMTVAGTGDVLAGICAGFIAQKVGLFDAACNAAYLNGKIGDLLKKKKGYSFIASDIVEHIKKLKRIRK